MPRKAWLFAEEPFEAIALDIGEIAAPTARDADFLGAARAVIDHHHLEAALASDRCAEQARGTTTDDREIVAGRRSHRAILRR